jgi:hypothetical protein
MSEEPSDPPKYHGLSSAKAGAASDDANKAAASIFFIFIFLLTLQKIDPKNRKDAR